MRLVPMQVARMLLKGPTVVVVDEAHKLSNHKNKWVPRSLSIRVINRAGAAGCKVMPRAPSGLTLNTEQRSLIVKFTGQRQDLCSLAVNWH